MHSASLPYAHRYLSIAVISLLVVNLTGPVSAQKVDLSTDDAHYHAPLRWSGPSEALEPNATARWTQLDGRVIAWSVAASGVFACHGDQGSAQLANGSLLDGTCSARQANGTLAFAFTTDNSTWSGTVTGEIEKSAALEQDDGTPSPVPGFIVTFLALLFLITTAIFAVLYVQERRIAHYLVRRLYEETKGRMPADWPENMRQQWIARIFIRGKN